MNLKSHVSIIFTVAFILQAPLFAAVYSVTGSLDEGSLMTPRYRVTGTDIGCDEKSKTAYLVVYSEGDCEWSTSPRCQDVFAPDHSWMYRDCWNEVEKTCQKETGFYPLPQDQVIFDGDTRLKYVGNSQYDTIARKDRIWFFPFKRQWNLKRDHCTVSISEDLREATLRIEVKE